MGFKLICIWIVLLWTAVSGSRLERMEEKVKLLESRQRQEIINRLEDVSRIFDRLDSMETPLNVSQKKCCSDEKSKDSSSFEQENAERPTAREALLIQAFKDEKQEHIRLKQNVSEIDDMVNHVSRVLSSVKNEIDIANDAREQTEEKCQSSYIALSKKLDESIRNFGEQMKTIEIANDALEQTEEKCQSSFIALSKKLDENIQKFGEQMKTIENKIKSNFDTILNNIEMIKKDNRDFSVTEPLVRKHKSCLSIYQGGLKENGVYNIYPQRDDEPVQVYCDMTTDGGGWTVFQRRQDGSVDFYRDWDDYKQGFGDVSGEFWLGNDHIAALTSGSYHELRIELEDFDGGASYAKYEKFQVLPESDNYKLIVGGYSGDAGDALESHNNRQFSTKDRDNNDNRFDCAAISKGGWWYWHCHLANLNGLYLQGPRTTYDEGVYWSFWRSYTYSLKMTEMKLR